MAKEHWDISVPNLRRAEKVQQLDDYPIVGSVYRGIEMLLYGSSSPNYVRSRWYWLENVLDENEQSLDLPITEADPNARLLSGYSQRLKNKSAVFSSSRNVLDMIKARHPEGVYAAVFSLGEFAMAGVLPEGVDFGHLQYGARSTISMREGHQDFGGSPAIFIDTERTVIAPQDTFVIARHIPTKELQERYPSTPLV